jgi:hypothetical protein
MFVQDAVSVLGSPTVVVERLVAMLKRFGLHRVTIERTPGAEAFQSIVENHSLAEGWPVTINWIDAELDQATRDLRIRSIEPLLASKRLVIDEAMRFLRELRHQLFNFGATVENELADTLSRVASNLPASILNDNDLASQRAWEDMRERDLHDRIYGKGAYARQMEMVAEPEPEPEYVAPYNEHFSDDEMVPGLYV